MAAKLRNSTYRFAVGDPDGARGLTWRFWTNAAKSDVYLAARTSARIMKVSLHQHGWRLAFIDPASPFLLPGQDRAIDKWPRPAPIEGWTRGFSIGVPTFELAAPTTRAREKGDVDWFGAPPPDLAWNFDVALAPREVAYGIWPNQKAGSRIVHLAPLASGEVAAVIASLDVVSESFKDNIRLMKADARKQMEAKPLPPGVHVGDLRMFGHGRMDDGARFFVDAAAPDRGHR